MHTSDKTRSGVWANLAAFVAVLVTGLILICLGGVSPADVPLVAVGLAALHRLSGASPTTGPGLWAAVGSALRHSTAAALPTEG
ncbi:hypothetical protein NGM33_06620 [Nocardiopsis dassonvillei]|uniref:hypothetical protein n=1 Tax=Nocardiopsis dassonvillei TaxID=2014 RepID=UPI0020A388BC|nr:hypothetical protein [Nocardiopsis dassonvillei]MCP3013001.1 hypothetical protein [Nocardiopsis dassonvillei]